MPPKGDRARSLPLALTATTEALPAELVRALLEVQLPFGGGRPFQALRDPH